MILQFSVFFSTKMMGIIKIHFGHYVEENVPSGFAFPRIFRAGIGPLQLNVVLVVTLCLETHSSVCLVCVVCVCMCVCSMMCSDKIRTC